MSSRATLAAVTNTELSKPNLRRQKLYLGNNRLEASMYNDRGEARLVRYHVQLCNPCFDVLDREH
jgi:hypothetical protein